MYGVEDDRQSWAGSGNLCGDLKSIQTGHGKTQHDQAWLEINRFGQRLLAIGGFATNLPPVVGLNEPP